jgi:hypothetical protein
MKKYFNTKEKAQKHLEYRKKCAYDRIEKKEDKILGDASFIYKNKEGKWIVFVQILTEKMMEDIEEIQKTFDFVYPLIPFTNEEKIVKIKEKLKKVEKKYKTLDIEEYTINKST